jgi:putative FmdB family regulatory protein
MPIYEYKCQSCENELEKLQRISDPPLTDCPSCDEPALERLISAAGFRLKGAGWYETDFKKGSKKNLHDSGENKSNSESKDSKPVADPKAPAKSSETSKSTGSAASTSSDAV